MRHDAGASTPGLSLPIWLIRQKMGSTREAPIQASYTSAKTRTSTNEHYHGWHDYATPESGQGLGGVPQAIQDEVLVAPTDAAAVDRILTDDDHIAAVIVECNGAHYGTYPLPNPQFLQDLRGRHLGTEGKSSQSNRIGLIPTSESR